MQCKQLISPSQLENSVSESFNMFIIGCLFLITDWGTILSVLAFRSLILVFTLTLCSSQDKLVSVLPQSSIIWRSKSEFELKPVPQTLHERVIPSK